MSVTIGFQCSPLPSSTATFPQEMQNQLQQIRISPQHEIRLKNGFSPLMNSFLRRSDDVSGTKPHTLYQGLPIKQTQDDKVLVKIIVTNNTTKYNFRLWQHIVGHRRATDLPLLAIDGPTFPRTNYPRCNKFRLIHRLRFR